MKPLLTPHLQPLKIVDPIKFLKWNWPDVTLYREQKQILYSLQENDETIVPAGNQLGKDFIAAYCALWFFLSRQSRVVTTSVKHDQLSDVLWGEIRRFLSTSKHELPVRATHLNLRRTNNDGEPLPLWELTGQVSSKNEGLLGRHLRRGPCGEPTTLAIFDEASGIDDGTYTSTETWAHRKLIIGNPFPCANFFFRNVKAGDYARENGKGFYRKIIKIKAADSPNVRLAQAQINAGYEPTNEIVVPGVKSYEDYVKHRLLWDKVLQCIGLDAEFYEGASVLMYPPDWLNRAEDIDRKLPPITTRKGKAIGVDPAEGGDDSTWTVVDELGILEQLSMKTPDTNLIPNTTIMLMTKWAVIPENVVFDRGGGGKQHADSLRAKGYNVRTIAFGESATPEMKPFYPYESFKKQIDTVETQYVFKNRRAQMYWILRQWIDPSLNERGFGIPADLAELRRQLAPIPLLFDGEGRIELPPKNKRDKSSTVTMTDLIGCSPDEADSTVLALFGLTFPQKNKFKVGAII